MHLKHGKKLYIQFRYNLQILESFYPNMYFGLQAYQAGKPIANVLARTRLSELPKFTVQLLKSEMGRVNTPLPSDASNIDLDNYNPEGLPTPKGRYHVTTRTIYAAHDSEKVQYKELVPTIRSEAEEREMNE